MACLASSVDHRAVACASRHGLLPRDEDRMGKGCDCTDDQARKYRAASLSAQASELTR